MTRVSGRNNSSHHVQKKKKTEENKNKEQNKVQNQHQNQANKTQDAQKLQEAKKAEETKNDYTSQDLTDRERGIRNEINSNIQEDGSSSVKAQEGDTLGNVTRAALDKDGDGKLSEEEMAGKEQFVKDMLASNPGLAELAEKQGIDLNDPEAVMNLKLEAGQEIKIPADEAAAEEAGEEAGPESGAGCEAGSPEAGKAEEGKAPESGAGSEAGSPKAGGAEGAKGAQEAKDAGEKQTVEGLISKASQLIQQAEAGGQAAQQQTQTQKPADIFNMGMQQMAGAMSGGAGGIGGAGAAGGAGGGNPVQMAQEAKGLLQQAKGMIAQKGGGNQQAQQAQQPQQGMMAQGGQGMQGMMGMQGMQGQQAQALDENTVKQMPDDQKLQVIEQLDKRADKVIQGGGQGQNPLMNMLMQNNPMNASNNFAAQNMLKPNLPQFIAA